MTKDVLVSISGVHMTEGQNDDVAVIMPGSYYYKNGKHYVIYEEMIDGYKETVKSTIKIGPRSLDIIKNGAVAAHMVFEKNKKNVTLYDTPMGRMSMGFNTSEIMVSEDENHLRVTVDYSLEVNYEPMSECSIVVDVQSKETADMHLTEGVAAE